jgi:hypothetical protein
LWITDYYGVSKLSKNVRKRILRPAEPRNARFAKGDAREVASNFRSAGNLYVAPASEKIPTDQLISAAAKSENLRITRLPAAHARGSRVVTMVKGGMCDGPTGSNGIGLIPAAYRGTRAGSWHATAWQDPGVANHRR